MPSPPLQRLRRELEKQRVSENREKLVWGAGMAEGTPQPAALLGVDCLKTRLWLGKLSVVSNSLDPTDYTVHGILQD